MGFQQQKRVQSGSINRRINRATPEEISNHQGVVVTGIATVKTNERVRPMTGGETANMR